MPVRKQAFDIARGFQRIGKAIAPFPKAAMFQLAEEGFSSVFEQLAACMISIRTRDEATVPIARRLFSVAKTPAGIANLGAEQIGELNPWLFISRGEGATDPTHRLAQHPGVWRIAAVR
jgi:endonuclease-3